MKKSELKSSIREEILELLEAVTPDDVEVAKSYNAELEKTKALTQDLTKENEDEEPTASQLKKEPLSKIGYKLADTQKEMKSVVKKWKNAEGAEKERLTNRLRDLTKIKKELEGLL